jgi:OOP family OmpA-OmpF porin
MKIRALVSTVATLVLVGHAGCKAKASIKAGTPEPKKEEPKKEEPKKEEPPPPPEKVAVVKEEPRLVGLPLQGSEITVVGTIEFDTGSADIRQTPQTLGVLNTVANAGKVYTQITKLRVEGHTDSDGDDAANLNLSERRANAVVRWLVDRGIASSRLYGVGCGERDPIATNTTDEGKQRNRRTEFDIEEIGGGRFELATRPCDPNPQRTAGGGLVAVNAQGNEVSVGVGVGTAGGVGLDKSSYRGGEKVRIKYSQPMTTPSGQQYWVTLVKASEPDSTYGTWHYVKQGATSDEIEVGSNPEGSYEVRLHDLYPKHPYRVISRTKVTVTK